MPTVQRTAESNNYKLSWGLRELNLEVELGKKNTKKQREKVSDE